MALYLPLAPQARAQLSYPLTANCGISTRPQKFVTPFTSVSQLSSKESIFGQSLSLRASPTSRQQKRLHSEKTPLKTATRESSSAESQSETSQEAKKEPEESSAAEKQTETSQGAEKGPEESKRETVDDIGKQIAQLRQAEAKKPDEGPGQFWQGVLEETRMIQWPTPGRVVTTTGVVVAMIIGSSVVLLTLNYVLAELSDTVFSNPDVKEAWKTFPF